MYYWHVIDNHASQPNVSITVTRVLGIVHEKTKIPTR